MGVYIEGIEMPKNCGECFACKAELYQEKKVIYVCCFTREEYGFNGNRMDNCPLVPIPSHGRLIDADALIDYCKHFAEVFKSSSLPTDKARRDELLGVIGEIINAPAIIQAESITAEEEKNDKFG